MFNTEKINIDKLIFDFENPRFLSDSQSQEQIFQYLIDYENVNELARNIEENGYNGIGERLICLKDNNNYIVLEGNRRLAACKILNMKKPNTILDFLCDVVQNRNEADYSIASKHISGIKRWPPITKKYFYAKKFLTGNALEEIMNYSPETKGEIKKQIIGFLFIDYFYKINKNVLPVNERMLEKIDTDILDSRIFLRLKEGLGFEIDDANLSIKHSSQEKNGVFDEILSMIGKELWKEESKLNTRTINNKKDWEKMLVEDIIVPGLKEKINEYLGTNNNDLILESLATSEKEPDDEEPEIDDLFRNVTNADNVESDLPFDYVPKYKINNLATRNKILTQLQLNELKTICESNDKIKSVVWELNYLFLDKTPISISFLIRAMCEYVVQAYDLAKSTNFYDRGNLQGSLLKLTNSLSASNIIDNKVSVNITNLLKNQKMIDILNGVIHNIDVSARPTFLKECYETMHPLFSKVSNNIVTVPQGGV